jgi:Ras family protein T1
MTPSSSPGEPIDGISSHPSSPSSIVSEGGVTISSSPLPSVDTSKDTESLYFHDFTGPSLSYLSWMNRWHMICTISPTIARAEMYKIGHSLEQDPPRFSLTSTKVGEVTTNHNPYMTKSPITIVRAIVLGSKDSGKRGFIHKLHRWHSPSGNKSESECTTTSSSVSTLVVKDEQTTVHLILTEVPAIDLSNDSERMNLRSHLVTLLSRTKSGERPYDLVILAFDATSIQSLDYAIDLERYVLTDYMPRVFIGTTIDESAKASHPFREAVRHCIYMELGPPILISFDVDTKLYSSVLERFVSCILDVRQVGVSFRSIPHSEKKRRAAKRCKILWIGGIVTAGITFVLGFTIGGNKKMSSSAYAACGVTVFRGASAAIMRRFTV